MRNSPPPKGSKAADSGRSAPSPRSTTAAPAVSGQAQLAAFEAAMRLFHARKFRDAREKFVAAKGGPERDIAQRAGLHIQMCDRRLEEAVVRLETAEDYYNYGVALINSRHLAEAHKHLRKAVEMAPASDHVQYAQALCFALTGDLDKAYDHLKRAIELDGRNRLAARQDADFAPFLNRPPLDALVFPEKRNW